MDRRRFLKAAATTTLVTSLQKNRAHAETTTVPIERWGVRARKYPSSAWAATTSGCNPTSRRASASSGPPSTVASTSSTTAGLQRRPE